MSEILLEANKLRTSGSQAQEEGPVVFETIDDVPNDMIIQNGYGEPESSDEEAPAQHQRPPPSPAAPRRKEAIPKAYQGPRDAGPSQPRRYASSSSGSTSGESAVPSWAHAPIGYGFGDEDRDM